MQTSISRNIKIIGVFPFIGDFNLHEVLDTGILVVDDEPKVRNESQWYLKEAGFIVDTAEDEASAYERLLEGGTRYNVLITAHHMPKLNGESLIKKLRSEKLYPDLLTILTVYPEEIDLTKIIATLPNVTILSKPLEYQCLPDIVKGLIEEKERHGPAGHRVYAYDRIADKGIGFFLPQKDLQMIQ